MTYPSSDHFQLHPTTLDGWWVTYKVVVKEKEWEEWYEGGGRWRKKSSAYYSSDGGLLRKHVYDHLTFSPQARQTALLNDTRGCLDVDVLYWLLKTTSTEELEQFKISLDNNYSADDNGTYLKMVRCLLSTKFPFQLPLKQYSHFNTVINYAIDFANYYNMLESRFRIIHSTSAIKAVELLVDLFSADIVHWRPHPDKSTLVNDSFLDMAEHYADHGGLIHIYTKLLSVSQLPLENHLQSIIPRFESVLLEAIKRGYKQLVNKLLDFKSEMTLDASLLMHILRDTTLKGSSDLLQKLLTLYSSEISNELNAKDKDQKTILHYAAESGDSDVFQLLLISLQSVKGVDKYGKNVLHSAAQGKNGHHTVDVLKEKESILLDLMKSKDNRGRTPLHIASSKGNNNMVDKLLALLGDDRDRVTKYVKETDIFRRTALQMASSGGHRAVVKTLLHKAKWDLLAERDVRGKTALHYAAQAGDPEDTVAICQQLLQSSRYSSQRSVLETYEDSSQPSLLLWASAGGIRSADEGEGVHPFVKTFLENEKEREKETQKSPLLIEAAFENNVEMVWELLNRVADIDDLRDPQSRPSVANVLRQLDLLKEHGRDQPSMEAKLGRHVFAEGLAAPFLNRFIESPITVSICGEWEMSKSSLMIQTEKILLITAGQLTLPNLLKPENFAGAKKISRSRKGHKIYEVRFTTITCIGISPSYSYYSI